MIVTPPTPEDVSRFLFARSKLSKHLPGQHDQSTHGNWAEALGWWEGDLSMEITEAAATLVNAPGWTGGDTDDKELLGWAEVMIDAVDGSPPVGLPLFSGHGGFHQIEGDRFVVPLMATSTNENIGRGFSRGGRLYQFDEGTPGAQINEQEYVVSGVFEVVGRTPSPRPGVEPEIVGLRYLGPAERKLNKHSPGGHDHDQMTHGNRRVPKMATVYHGTTKAAADIILREGFKPTDPQAIAHYVEDEYGLERDSILNHTYFGFGRMRIGDQNIYFAADPDDAEYYAGRGSEMLADALSTAYRIKYPPPDEIAPGWKRASGVYPDSWRDSMNKWVTQEAERLTDPVVLEVELPANLAFARDVRTGGFYRNEEGGGYLPHNLNIPADKLKGVTVRIKKHYPGQHDQLDHGNWSRGSTAQKLYHASARRNRESIRQEGLRLSDVDRQHIWATSEPDEIEHFSFMEFDVWEIDAEGLQLAGEFHPGLLRGVENTRVLHEVVPPSRLKLVRQYGRLPAGMSARMVSEWDGEKWVSRSMRQTTGRFGTPLSKHYGPGPHPGTMTEQTVHGTQSGEIDFDLTDINIMRSSLLTGVVSPSTAKSWALEHVNRLRPILFGLDSPELAIDPKNYQTRLGSYIQRLNNLYYTAENLQYSDEELDEFTKHADHDQSSHGNWARGDAVQRGWEVTLSPKARAKYGFSGSLRAVVLAVQDPTMRWDVNQETALVRLIDQDAETAGYPTTFWIDDRYITEVLSEGHQDRFTKRETKRTPEFPHGPSIKWPRVYEALRRLGYSKEKAARISNAHWNKYRRWGRAGNPGPASEEEYRSERGRKPRKHKGIPFPKSRRVKKTITPDDLARFLYARSLVRKHTPGGVEHDQADHGNWSSGSTQDWRSLYQEARTKEGPRINSEFTTYVQGLPVRVIASLNTVTYGGQIRTYFSDGSSSARSFSGDEESLLARIEEQLQETEGNIAALPPQPLPPPKQKSLFEDDKYKSGGAKKKTRSATGKTEGDITDPEPTEGWSVGDPWDETIAEDYANDIFEAELTLGTGEKFRAEINETFDAGDGNFETVGVIEDEYGDEMARFRRSVNLLDGQVYNAEFFIDEEYQGKGIGTIMLAHWESELAAAGVTEMHLGTAEIGKYAWAMSGYDFEDEYRTLALHRLRDFLNRVETGQWHNSALEPFAQYPEVVEEVRDFVDRHEGKVPDFSAWELASLGADKERIDGYYGPAHFGKELMLTGDSWDGVKQIA